MRVNPLAEVKGVGKRKHGKEQLRIDEARTWKEKALELAYAGEAGAVAALVMVVMGTRCSEIVSRAVRDLAGDPRCPPWPLRALANGKPGDAWLFPADGESGRRWRDWPRKQIACICDAAGVPMISARGARGT